MTEQTPAVTLADPPAALMRVVNPALRLLLRAPILSGAAKTMMVLSFTGRKSGRRYSVPVSAHDIDGELYALARAAWRVNFRGGTAAEVLHGGKTTTMRGELIEEPSAVAALARRSAELYGAKAAQRMMGMKFRDAGIPTVEDFTAAARLNHVSAIRLTPA